MKLRFSTILVPALLGTVVFAELQSWDPLLLLLLLLSSPES